MHNEKENEQSRENISGNCNTDSCVVFYVQYVADANSNSANGSYKNNQFYLK